MKKVFILLIFVIVMCTFVTENTSAEQHLAYGVHVTVYAQSRASSGGNLIKVVEGMFGGKEHPWCGNRAYIAFEDKELFTTALTAYATGKAVNLMYDDASYSPVVADGHGEFKCRILSIWQEQ